MNKLAVIVLTAIVLFGISPLSGRNNKSIKGKPLKFVSFPDFFNFDIPKPWPGYDTAVNYFLGEVKRENPDFVMVDGDLVNGHWWNSPQCVKQMGTIFYSAWVSRMQEHGLKFYTAVGDHELGDDPWPQDTIR